MTCYYESTPDEIDPSDSENAHQVRSDIDFTSYVKGRTNTGGLGLRTVLLQGDSLQTTLPSKEMRR